MKKMLTVVLIFSLVISLFNVAFVRDSVHANEEDIGVYRIKLYPVLNTYVHSSNANISYGNENNMGVGNGREIYMQFDLSTINIDDFNLIEAKLHLYKTDSNTNTLALNHVQSDSWDDSITWNTRPAKGDQLATFVASGQNRFTTVEVTTHVKDELIVSEDNIWSINIERLTTANPNGFATTRAESEEQRPYLEIITMSNSSIVAADKAALSGLDGKSVNLHQFLPTIGTLGSTITWSSSNPDVISNTGRVQRPEAGSGNVDVVLTATVQMKNVVDSYQATVTVLERSEKETYKLYPEVDTYVHSTNPSVSFDTAIDLGVGNGRETYLRFDLSDIAEEQEKMVFVEANLNLYKRDANTNTLGLFYVEDNDWNSNINWNNKPSKGEQFTSFNASGQNRYVTVNILPALMNKLQSDNRKFSFNIERLSGTYPNGFNSTRSEESTHPYLEVVALTYEGAIDQEAEELLFRNGSNVYTDVELPLVGKYGSTISWNSSHPQVISTSGAVTRPLDQDVTVTLTATIQLGSVTKAFELVYNVVKFTEITPQHPQIYADNGDKAAIVAKIEANEWAQNSYSTLRSKIDSLIQKTLEEPDYVTSRMSMYWKDGERYTQTYVKSQNFDYGTGNAPVPTVRMPGMRTWNAYKNPPLEMRIPYSEDGSMYGIEKTNQTTDLVLIPYKETGHLVWGNNEEILYYAQNAAFIYWISGEEKYAKFAADIYWQWLLGTYYMNPPLDPDKSLGGPGGYAPGGISGYYDYEVIHDTLGGVAAVTYDFLHDYLEEHADDYININLDHDQVVLDKDVTTLSSIVFKRFIDIGFVRGHKEGNWNTNFWNSIMNIILALESNDYYDDFKGKEYYLQYYTTYSTQYHQAIPEIMESYNEVTGLWPESPGYAFGTINTILSNAIPIYRSGVDIIAGNTIVNKAALAPLAWLDARGLAIRLGDGSGGPLDYSTFERLATYYNLIGDSGKQEEFMAVIQSGIDGGFYNRNNVSFVDIIQNVETLPEAAALPFYRTAYSEHHRHITMKNLNDTENGLMATLYGGRNGDHLHNNGLAMQLYGKGWALGPNILSYESYWSADYGFSKEAVGSNTILPGYTTGPVTINAIDPAPASGELTNTEATSEYVQFSDMSADEKRRQVSIIRTSPTTGYYVDIFRSDQLNNDYIYRNLGDEMVVSDAAGQVLDMNVASDLTGYPKYDIFTDAKKVEYNGDIQVKWSINRTNPSIVMDMWMKGQDGRTVYAANSYKSSRAAYSAPQNLGFEPTPTLVVRQNDHNAWDAPFISVFEPYEGDKKSIKSINDFGSTGNFTGISVESNPLNSELVDRKEYIFSSSDDEDYSPHENVNFNGMYGVASENENGFLYLYLGKGKLLQFGNYRLSSSNLISANLEKKTDGLYYTSTEEVSITIPYTTKNENAKYDDLILAYEINDEIVEISATVANEQTQTLTATLPAGSNVKLKIVGDEFPVQVEELAITPMSVVLEVGAEQELLVTASYSNERVEDITESVSYSTSNSVVATVSEAGVVTALAKGTATITAVFEGKSITVEVTVIDGSEAQADKTELNSKISEALQALSNAEAGNGLGQYPIEAMEALENAIEAAKAVADHTAADQASVDAAISILEDAVAVFNASRNAEVNPEPEPIEDTEPPTWPESSKITATRVGTSTVTLAWDEAADNVGVAGYKVTWKSGIQEHVQEVAQDISMITISGLQANRNYSFELSASDNAGNWSSVLRISVTTRTSDATPIESEKPKESEQPIELEQPIESEQPVEPVQSEPPQVEFIDVSLTHWAASAIKRAAALGIIKGHLDNTFRPNAPTTRAEFMTMLANAFKWKGEQAELPFKDREQIGVWAQDAVVQGMQRNIITGYKNGDFRPNQEITRTEMIVMLARALGISNHELERTQFIDDGEIPVWAKRDVGALHELGIVTGRSNNSFAPNDAATRAEALVIIMRVLEKADQASEGTVTPSI